MGSGKGLGMGLEMGSGKGDAVGGWDGVGDGDGNVGSQSMVIRGVVWAPAREEDALKAGNGIERSRMIV